MNIKQLKLSVCLLLASALLQTQSFAVSSSADYAQVPLSLTEDKTPMVMLAMSNDHQLYYRAYSDYTDLDGDGVIDEEDERGDDSCQIPSPIESEMESEMESEIFQGEANAAPLPR